MSSKNGLFLSQRSVSSGNPPPYNQAQREGVYANANRSPRVARHLVPVIRPVYDDTRALSNGANQLSSSQQQPQRFADAEVIANPLARRHYCRSVSSLDVSMEEDDTPKPTYLKEYGGSASSIDLGKSGKTTKGPIPDGLDYKLRFPRNAYIVCCWIIN